MPLAPVDGAQFVFVSGDDVWSAGAIDAHAGRTLVWVPAMVELGQQRPVELRLGEAMIAELLATRTPIDAEPGELFVALMDATEQAAAAAPAHTETAATAAQARSEQRLRETLQHVREYVEMARSAPVAIGTDRERGTEFMLDRQGLASLDSMLWGAVQPIARLNAQGRLESVGLTTAALMRGGDGAAAAAGALSVGSAAAFGAAISAPGNVVQAAAATVMGGAHRVTETGPTYGTEAEGIAGAAYGLAAGDTWADVFVGAVGTARAQRVADRLHDLAAWLRGDEPSKPGSEPDDESLTPAQAQSLTLADAIVQLLGNDRAKDVAKRLHELSEWLGDDVGMDALEALAPGADAGGCDVDSRCPGGVCVFHICPKVLDPETLAPEGGFLRSGPRSRVCGSTRPTTGRVEYGGALGLRAADALCARACGEVLGRLCEVTPQEAANGSFFVPPPAGEVPVRGWAVFTDPLKPGRAYGCNGVNDPELMTEATVFTSDKPFTASDMFFAGMTETAWAFSPTGTQIGRCDESLPLLCCR